MLSSRFFTDAIIHDNEKIIQLIMEYAIKRDQVSLTNLINTENISVNLFSYPGTATYRLAAHDNLPTAEWLIENFDGEIDDVLRGAAFNNQPELVERFITHDESILYAIAHAAQGGHVTLMANLINQYAAKFPKDHENALKKAYTEAIKGASKAGNEELVFDLLKKDADFSQAIFSIGASSNENLFKKLCKLLQTEDNRDLCVSGLMIHGDFNHKRIQHLNKTFPNNFSNQTIIFSIVTSALQGNVNQLNTLLKHAETRGILMEALYTATDNAFKGEHYSILYQLIHEDLNKCFGIVEKIIHEKKCTSFFNLLINRNDNALNYYLRNDKNRYFFYIDLIANSILNLNEKILNYLENNRKIPLYVNYENLINKTLQNNPNQCKQSSHLITKEISADYYTSHCCKIINKQIRSFMVELLVHLQGYPNIYRYLYLKKKSIRDKVNYVNRIYYCINHLNLNVSQAKAYISLDAGQKTFILQARQIFKDDTLQISPFYKKNIFYSIITKFTGEKINYQDAIKLYNAIIKQLHHLCIVTLKEELPFVMLNSKDSDHYKLYPNYGIVYLENQNELVLCNKKYFSKEDIITDISGLNFADENTIKQYAKEKLQDGKSPIKANENLIKFNGNLFFKNAKNQRRIDELKKECDEKYEKRRLAM